VREFATKALAVGCAAWLLSGLALATTPPGTRIVNIAQASAQIVDGSGTRTLDLDSNPVVTQVAAFYALDLSLEALPGTTVAPGTVLTLRLTYRSEATADLSRCRVRLPLDPSLPTPLSFTTVGGAFESTLALAAYDASAHQVTWDLLGVEPGTSGVLEVQVQVPSATPEDALLVHRGFGDAPELPAEALSNQVDVHVLAPILTLTKLADREAAQVGDTVGYRLTAENASAATELTTPTVIDVLPPGFRYVDGSAAVDGAALPPPAVSADGRTLTLTLPPLPAAAKQEVRYRARILPGAERGDGINIASATAVSTGGAILSSGAARAGLRIDAGMFSGESVLVGRVFVDDDGDGRPGNAEPGVPGVRLFLEDGTFVLTDVMGKYHLEGIRRGLHVLRLDGQTLPPGLEPRAAGTRAAGDDDTLFVDLAPDELYKANFAVVPPAGRAPRLLVRVNGETPPSIAVPSAVFGGEAGPHPMLGPRAEELAHYVRDLGRVVRWFRIEPADAAPEAVAAAVEREMTRALGLDAKGAEPAAGEAADDERIRQMPPTLAIVSPAEGARIPHASAEVEVRVPLPATPRLQVNGAEIPAAQIGKRQTWERGGIGVYTYLNVPMREGKNEIELRAEADGRTSEEVDRRVVHRPGPAAAVRIEASPTPADGTTEARVRLIVVDVNGQPVAEDAFVTVSVDVGDLAGVDADPSREGFQVRARDGEAALRLPPATVAAQRRVRARSGLAEGEGTVPYVAAAGKWLVVGSGEARFGSDAVAGLQEVDGDQVGDDDDPTVDGRLALFARGAVAGDHVLTFAYDSDRRRDPDQVFREIDPERFFPAYGDSSAQGYAAESSGKLFARWEHAGSAAVLGDFQTGLTGGELLRYDRRLSGAKADLAFGRFGMQAFAAESSRTLVRDEISGAGISGPYALTRRPIVANSELVTVETRDRFHTERVLERRVYVRYVDYTLDTFEGTILFKEPIAAADAAFNPVTIVALYETDEAGDRHALGGGRASVRLPGHGEIGATLVGEDHEAGDAMLGGVDIRFDPLPGLSLLAEAARSDDPLAGEGDAMRFEAVGHIGPRARLRGYYRDLDPTFVNPSRSGAGEEGTRKYGVEAQADLPAQTRLRAEAFSQEDRRNGAERQVAGADLEREFGRFLLGGGYRYTASEGGGAPDVAAHLLRGSTRVHFTPKVDGVLERDQVLGGDNVDGYPTRTRGGVDWRLPDGSKLFVRQEVEQGDGPTANRTLAGVESRLGEYTTVTGQYTLEDAIAGHANRANVGLRTTLPLGPFWTGQFFGERVATITGDPAQDFTSAGAGFEYLADRLKLSGRYEIRLGQEETRHLMTAGGAIKLGADYSLFLRQRLAVTDFEASQRSQIDHDLLTGVAYRPIASDRWNWLLRFELHGDGGGSLVGTPRRSTAGIAFEVNYTPARDWQIGGKVASRWVAEETEIAARTLTSLVQIRAGRDLGERWNLGAVARVLGQSGSDVRETGYGVEGGFLVLKGFWTVAGYNVTGFDDGDFSAAEQTEKGPYLALRFKFDETTFTSWR
jgi:uncharacterized repeat protein (TIGR01451 family)